MSSCISTWLTMIQSYLHNEVSIKIHNERIQRARLREALEGDATSKRMEAPQQFLLALPKASLHLHHFRYKFLQYGELSEQINTTQEANLVAGTAFSKYPILRQVKLLGA